ncbi:MAG: ImmA/IrrE family metallo-endopeptidase [Beijerinckiaceae bacterium]
MADDYKVKGRSDLEIRQLAKRTREFCGVAKDRRVDMIACLEREKIWTVKGIKRLHFEVRPDTEMGTADGMTSHSEGIVTIAVKQSVRDAAYMGDGRARNTLAHELGHLVMHDGAEMPRLATGNITPKWLKPFESAEHHVKVFAPAFLINDAIAETLSGAEEISIEFGISYESAKIYFKELTAFRGRERTAEKMRRLAEEFRESIAPRSRKLHFLNEACPVCGNRTLFPVDAKFMCQHCDTVFDRFQDGDPGEF